MSTESEGCLPCTEGSFCPLYGMTAPFECGEGFYSRKGAHECNLCQTGYKCDGTTMDATTYMLDSNKCDGWNCEIWENVDNSAYNIYEKSECEEGHYCPSDSKVQIPCPRGTFRDHTPGDEPKLITDC